MLYDLLWWIVNFMNTAGELATFLGFALLTVATFSAVRHGVNGPIKYMRFFFASITLYHFTTFLFVLRRVLPESQPLLNSDIIFAIRAPIRIVIVIYLIILASMFYKPLGRFWQRAGSIRLRKQQTEEV